LLAIFVYSFINNETSHHSNLGQKMKIRKLEHFNIRTERLEETLQFYTKVLSLRDGPRPGNPPRETGAWLYSSEDVPVVHVTAFKRTDAVRLKWMNEYLGYRDIDSLNGSGAVDHMAFMAEGYEQTLEHCRALAIPFRERLVAALNLRQLFVTDPNGISIELNFHGLDNEAEAPTETGLAMQGQGESQ
jgi:catechol 2,3-dioxygenase-like lactoylglutathione lyase family enzyme